MEDIDNRLEEETEKWLERLESREIDGAENERSGLFVENIGAYKKDAKHFLDEDKLIEAFEAVVWAWAWLEIGEELDILD